MQHNNELFFSNEPLPKSDTTITLDIVSEEPAMRGIELARKKILEGKITLNPQSNHIYALPSMPAIAGQPLQTSNRTKWDFYLVTIPFTLHEAPGKNYYHKVTFYVDLRTPNSTAFDLFPKNITMPVEKATAYTIASDMKIREVQDTSKLLRLRFDTLHPLITAFGEGENNFYWTYRASRRQQGVPPETKHVLVVLRVPHGTKVVEGTISYEIVIAKHFLGEWYDTDSEVDPYPIHWELEDAEPMFFSPQVQSQGQTMSTNTNKKPQVDVCILCALAYEAEKLKEAWEESQYQVKFQREHFQHAHNERLRLVYDYAILTNAKGEKLSVLVTWLPRYGSQETALLLGPLLEEFKPDFAAMTGICAGDQRKVKMGDIIVAEAAFLYDTGKVVIGEDRHKELQRDTQPWRPKTEVVLSIKGFKERFKEWKPVVEKEERPPSKQQQRDWLLSKLLDPETPHVDDIPEQELDKQVPDWRAILRELQTDPDAYITSDRKLKDPTRVRNLRFERVFPFKDAALEVYVAPIASGNAVRADNPFDEIRLPVRDTLAIEMEGAAFYRTLAEFDNIHGLLVKGVSDYADSNKDDTYRGYASKVSALYMLAFIREYVISSRFPALQDRTPKPSSPHTVTPTSTPPITKEPQKGLQLFYSYAPADDLLRKELDKHLTVLRRQELLRQFHAHEVGVGHSQLLEQAQIILLLISTDFMASDNLYDEQLKPALKMQEEGKARIIPILLRDTDLAGTPLEKVVIIPRNHKPVAEWHSKDAAFAEITREIRAVITQINNTKA